MLFAFPKRKGIKLYFAKLRKTCREGDTVEDSRTLGWHRRGQGLQGIHAPELPCDFSSNNHKFFDQKLREVLVVFEWVQSMKFGKVTFEEEPQKPKEDEMKLKELFI